MVDRTIEELLDYSSDTREVMGLVNEYQSQLYHA